MTPQFDPQFDYCKVPLTAILVAATPSIGDQIPWAFYAVVVLVSLLAQVPAPDPKA